MTLVDPPLTSEKPRPYKSTVSGDILRYIAVFLFYLWTKMLALEGVVLAPETDQLFPAPLAVWLPAVGMVFGILLGGRLSMLVPMILADALWLHFFNIHSSALILILNVLINTLPPAYFAIYMRRYTLLNIDVYPGQYLTRLIVIGAAAIAIIQTFFLFLIYLAADISHSLFPQFVSFALASALGTALAAPIAYLVALFARPRSREEFASIQRSLFKGIKAASLPLLAALLLLFSAVIIERFVGINIYLALVIPAVWMVIRQNRFFDQFYFLFPLVIALTATVFFSNRADPFSLHPFSNISVQITIILICVVAIIASALLYEARRKQGSLDKAVTQNDLLSAIDKASVAYMIADKAGVILYCSQSAIAFLGGATKDDLINKIWWDLDNCSQGLRARRIAVWEEALAKTDHWQGIVRWELSPGEKRFFDATATALENDRMILVLRDRTETVKAHQKIVANEHLRNIVLNAIPMMVLLQDVQGTIQYTNDFLPRKLKRRPSDIIGKAADEIPGCLSLQSVKTLVQKVCETGLSVEGQRVLVEEGEFAPSDWLLSVNPLTDNEGRIEQVLIVAMDRTERYHLQREKDMYAQRLAETQKIEAINRFAGGLAHELSNLLHPAGVYARALVQNPDSPSRETHLKVIDEAVLKAGDILRKTLKMTRGEPDKPSPQNLGILLTELVTYASEIAPRGLSYKLSVPDDQMTCLIDATGLQQVMMNLLINAAAAQDDRGQIDITLGLGRHRDIPTPCAIITVTDRGSGMDDETQKRIFEPFFTTKPVGSGTGLGLPMVRGLVSEWQGVISVDSTLGVGTSFYVHIPLHQEQTAKQKPQKNLEGTPHG